MEFLTLAVLFALVKVAHVSDWSWRWIWVPIGLWLVCSVLIAIVEAKMEGK